MEYLKNPIILGLLASGIYYMYLKWNEYSARLDNPNDASIEKPSLKYPILLGIVVFVAMSVWKHYDRTVVVKNIPIKIPVDIVTTSPNPLQVLKPQSIQPPIPVPSMRSGLGNALPHVFLETR